MKLYVVHSEGFRDHVDKYIISTLFGYVLNLEDKQIFLVVRLPLPVK